MASSSAPGILSTSSRKPTISPTSDSQQLPTAAGVAPVPPLVTGRNVVHILRPSRMADQNSPNPHPLIQNGEKLLIRKPAISPTLFRSTFDNLPALPLNYVSWATRMTEKFEGQWKKQGIDRAIFLSTRSYLVRSSFVLTISAFWNSASNCFLFPSGPIGPTLLDVAMIAGLPVVGHEAAFYSDGTYALSDAAKGVDLSSVAWTRFVDNNCQSAAITETEHIAFLLFFLSRFIVLPSSKVVSSSLLPLANALARGDKIVLGSMFLGASVPGDE